MRAFVTVARMLEALMLYAVLFLCSGRCGDPRSGFPAHHPAARLQGRPDSERVPLAPAAPSAPVDPRMMSGRASLLRHVLLNYLRGRVPDSVLADKVEELVMLVAGGTMGEGELLAGLEAKFGAKVDLDPHQF